jgi:hypothetical protein
MISLLPALALATAAGSSPAEKIPLPRPRPAAAPQPAEPAAETEPSECRKRLTAELAIAPSLPPINDPNGCMVPDVVRLEAIILADHTRVAVTPPATMACTMAEALVDWVRNEGAAIAKKDLGASLRSIDNYDSFSCRSRNNIPGAKLSEHGKANALDIRSFKLADGRLVKLTDPDVSKTFREDVKHSVCRRFSTVLGPGSDGYHEEHVHVDLMDRGPRHFQMCQWDVREPEPPADAAANVPLPRPRPNFERGSAAVRK